MIAIRVVGAVLFVVASSSYTRSANPGLHGRVTSKALNYAAQEAIDVLSGKIQSEHIPDASGSSHHLDYTLSNIRITHFTKPQSSITLQTGKGLTWATRNLGLSLQADFKYKYKKIIKISDHGTIDVSISGTTFSLSVGLGADGSGRPTASPRGCSSSVAGLSIKFHGGASWLYNLLRGLFEDAIKKQVQKMICSSAEAAINSNARKALSKLPMTVTIGKKFLLDYRLIGAPVFSAQYLDTLHKGEIFWSAAKTEAPFSAPALPAFANSTRMMYFLASDYLVNTLAYVAFDHNVLKKNVTGKDLPADKRSYLNTTCHGLLSLCLGSLVPEAARRYPNSKAELQMLADTPPKLHLSAGDIGATFTGSIAFWARTPNNSRFFMFSVKAHLNTTLRAWVKNELVYGEIDKLSLGVTMEKTDIGPIDADVLQHLLNGAIALYVKPKLNSLGAKGFPLPVTGQVKFTNTQLTLLQDAILLGTDFVYSPTMEQWNGMNRADRDFQVISGNQIKTFQHLK